MKKKLLVILLCLLCSGLFAKVYYTKSYDNVPDLLDDFNNDFPYIDLTLVDWKIITESYCRLNRLRDAYETIYSYRLVFYIHENNEEY